MTTLWLKAGNNAVITGGASGIGLAAATHYAAAGMNVLIADANEDALEQALTVLSSSGTANVFGQVCDVADIGQVNALQSAAEDKLGHVHCLMNNAGTGFAPSLPWEKPDIWKRQLEINLWGIIHGCQAFIPSMLASNETSVVINTGSKQGITNPPGNYAYNLSKAGVRAYSESVAHALRQIEGCQLSAHLLVPGFTYTGMIARFAPEKPPGAWTSDQVVRFMVESLEQGDFYILCPDNDTPRGLDEARIQWNTDDLIKNRSALSRWDETYQEQYEDFVGEAANKDAKLTVKLGYLIPTRESIMGGQHGTKALIDAGKRAQGLGYDSLWVGDSLTARPRHDPLTLLAGLATSVADVALGSAVLLPALRNPVVLAQQLATIDQLSTGRLIVGAGIAGDMSAIHAEFAAAGVPFEKRVGRFMEGFRLMRALWQGEPVDWDGRWQLHQQSVAPVPYREGGPPIWIGTASEAGLKRTARHFDGWFPIGPDPVTLAERRTRLLEHRGEKPITSALYATIAVMDDEALAMTAIDDYLAEYYGVPGSVMRKVQTCCGGNLDTVLRFLRSYVDVGVEHLVLRIVGDHMGTLESLQAVRSELV